MLDNLLYESNAKERDLDILKKRVMIETNELNNVNGRIDFIVKRLLLKPKGDDVTISTTIYRMMTKIPIGKNPPKLWTCLI